MIVRIPSSLKWLITKRARLLGAIKKAEQQSAIKRSSLKTLISDNRHNEKFYANSVQYLERYVEALKSDLKAIDATLRIHDIAIDPELIDPLSTQSSKRMFKHGAITRHIYSCFKSAKGESLTTTEIASFIANHYGINVVSEEFIKLRVSVRNRLKKLCSENKLLRLHDKRAAVEGKWELKDWTTPARIGRPKKITP